MRNSITTADDQMRFTSFASSTIANIMDYFYRPNPQIEYTELRDALSKGQLGSKYWLREALTDAICADEDFDVFADIGTKFNVAVIGGWLGTLPFMISQSSFGYHIDKYSVIDRDQRCQEFAEHLNFELVKDGKFEYVAFDVFHPVAAKAVAEADIVINTACEHFKDYSWLDLVRPGARVVAQSNNYTGPVDHVNICVSADNLKDKLNLSKVEFVGTMELPNVYDRYMVIGKK